MNVGALLRACRERAGLTQTQLAQRLHIEQACVSRAENDKKKLDIQTFVDWLKVTQAQEVAVAFLYGMDGVNIINQIMPFIGG